MDGLVSMILTVWGLPFLFRRSVASSDLAAGVLLLLLNDAGSNFPLIKVIDAPVSRTRLYGFFWLVRLMIMPSLG